MAFRSAIQGETFTAGKMETGEGFKSVMDHGVEVSTEFLPKIPCSKFTIIGNSRMRNKKPVRKKEPMWTVPRETRRLHKNQALEIGSEQSPELKRKSHEQKFGNQEELNRFDKNGIYGDAFHRTLDIMVDPGADGRDPALRYPESKVERKYIDDFYRDRTSLFLPNYGGNAPNKATRKFGMHMSLPSLKEVDGQQQQQTCKGNARHYCDVVGQRYCTSCLRVHRLDKLAVKARDKLEQQHPMSKSLTVLPRIRNHDHTQELTGTAPFSRRSVTRTKSSPLLARSTDFSRGRDTTGDLAGNQPDRHERKRRKLVQRTRVITDRVPSLSDIATDNESRHLTS